MAILGFDTATAMLSVGIIYNAEVNERNILVNRRHQELLFVEIQNLLKESQTEITDLKAVACGLGPGSFIGSRIAVAAAKTIAQVRGIPLIGIPTLDIIAASADGVEVLVASDALRGEIFFSFYKNNEPETDIQVIKPESLKKLLSNKSIKVTGSAIEKYPDVFTKLTKLPGETWYPHGKNIVKIAAKRYSLKQFDDPYKLLPIYVREVDARENFIECKR